MASALTDGVALQKGPLGMDNPSFRLDDGTRGSGGATRLWEVKHLLHLTVVGSDNREDCELRWLLLMVPKFCQKKKKKKRRVGRFREAVCRRKACFVAS